MSAEANLELVRQWVDQVWNAANLDQLSYFHPPTFDNHGYPSTIEETKQWHSRNRATFPDVHYTIDDMFATDDRVWPPRIRGCVFSIASSMTGLCCLRLAQRSARWRCCGVYARCRYSRPRRCVLMRSAHSSSSRCWLAWRLH